VGSEEKLNVLCITLLCEDGYGGNSFVAAYIHEVPAWVEWGYSNSVGRDEMTSGWNA
jgi:hypothetical protein